jgi:DNA-binding transcriptional LysR family regulator
MNFQQLTVFRAVCETGSFSQAAARMRLAQSAVSYHIKGLEATLGGSLFKRLHTRVHLTAKGKQFASHAERILSLIAEVERDMTGGQDLSGELRFGLGVSSLNGLLPSYVRRLKKAGSGIRFRLTTGSTPQILELLHSGEADLGIVSLPIQDREIWTSALFYEEEEMMVVVSRKGPFARRTVISPQELEGLPLILYDNSTATRASLDDFCRLAGITPMVFMEADREETILDVVRNGLGATILPRCFLSTRHQEGSLRLLRLRNAYLRRQVGVALPGATPRSPLVNTAVRLCHEHFHGTAHRSRRAGGGQ